MHLYCYILLELMENTLEEFAKYLTDTLDIKVDPRNGTILRSCPCIFGTATISTRHPF